jgi:heat shock protein HtpX
MGYLVYRLIVILFEILLGILAAIIVNAFSRWREYRADAGSARTVGKAKMIAALRKLQRTKDMIDTRQKSLATMKISDQSAFSLLFSTHPSLENRIARLQSLPVA